MFPQLTSRLKSQQVMAPASHSLTASVAASVTSASGSSSSTTTEELSFIPMECPDLPLDVDLKCKNMLHEKFDEFHGPLWRVQLITEQAMDSANLVRMLNIWYNFSF